MFYVNIPLNIDWQQILLHLLNFVILVGGLYFLLYNPVKKFMAKREEHYKTLEEEANNKINQANEKEVVVEERLANLNAEIRQNRIIANKQIEDFRTQGIKSAEQEAKEIINNAQRDAIKYKEKAIKEANREITEIIKDVAEKISLNTNNSEAFDEFLDKALDEAKK